MADPCPGEFWAPVTKQTVCILCGETQEEHSEDFKRMDYV